MSDFTPPPPFARQAPDPAPVAALPVAGQSPPYPFPNDFTGSGRPPGLTALGVASIVVACLSVIACLVTATGAAMFYLAARASDAAVAAHAPPPPPPAFLAPVDAAPKKVEVGPGGLAEAQRGVAVEALQSVRPLSAPRAEQLDAMLARAGWRILGLPDDAAFDADAVRAAVVDHGEMFTGNRRVVPPEYFKTNGGRLELHDDRAVFYPADGSPPVRSTTASAAPLKALSADQVQSVVKQVREAPGGSRLNAAQVSGVAAALSFQNQRLAQASSGLNKEPRGVTINPGGGATVRFGGGELYLSASGQILSEPPNVSRTTVAGANAAALAALLVSVAGNLGLAIVLIVAGVLILRATPARPRGRRPHTVWAAIKIPLAIAVSVCLYWMSNSFLRTAATLPPGLAFGNPAVARATRWANAAYWPAVIAPALGCVYAVVVLVAFRTPAIRDFYRRPA
jgi:hypothetical protein